MLESLLDRILGWATEAPGLSAVALVGSHARGEAGPDSDVDLILLTTRPGDLDEVWAARFGAIVRSAWEDWGRVQSLRVWYASGLEVEFGIAPPDWATDPDEGTRAVLRGGVRVLWDPGGLFGRGSS